MIGGRSARVGARFGRCSWSFSGTSDAPGGVTWRQTNGHGPSCRRPRSASVGGRASSDAPVRLRQPGGRGSLPCPGDASEEGRPPRGRLPTGCRSAFAVALLPRRAESALTPLRGHVRLRAGGRRLAAASIGSCSPIRRSRRSSPPSPGKAYDILDVKILGLARPRCARGLGFPVQRAGVHARGRVRPAHRRSHGLSCCTSICRGWRAAGGLRRPGLAHGHAGDRHRAGLLDALGDARGAGDPGDAQRRRPRVRRVGGAHVPAAGATAWRRASRAPSARCPRRRSTSSATPSAAPAAS